MAARNTQLKQRAAGANAPIRTKPAAKTGGGARRDAPGGGGEQRAPSAAVPRPAAGAGSPAAPAAVPPEAAGDGGLRRTGSAADGGLRRIGSADAAAAAHTDTRRAKPNALTSSAIDRPLDDSFQQSDETPATAMTGMSALSSSQRRPRSGRERRQERDPLQELMHTCGAEVVYDEPVAPRAPLAAEASPQRAWTGPHGGAGHGATGAMYKRVWRPASQADVPINEVGQLRARGVDGHWWPVLAESENDDGTFCCLVHMGAGRGEGGGRRAKRWDSVPLHCLQRQYELLPIPAVDRIEVSFQTEHGMVSFEDTEDRNGVRYRPRFQVKPPAAVGTGPRARKGSFFPTEYYITKKILWKPEWGRLGEPGWLDMPDIGKRFPLPRAGLAGLLAGLRTLATECKAECNIGEHALAAIEPQALKGRAKHATGMHRSVASGRPATPVAGSLGMSTRSLQLSPGPLSSTSLVLSFSPVTGARGQYSR
eukprot:TRINITY_DN47714_c0_g1_i1.p1 TRINITY_DN47714_c0_g1~~TRINITY_DN47714_c0_g1_i1.p1  ORF type:complete len:481 (+),score=35.59 TRINITY_DN47714_c0_g1_i1:80-1522(+)